MGKVSWNLERKGSMSAKILFTLNRSFPPTLYRFVHSALILLLILTLLQLPVEAVFAAPLPGFDDFKVFDGLQQPTVIQFASDGRVFIAEKSGIIKVYDNLTDTTPTIFADLTVNVYHVW